MKTLKLGSDYTREDVHAIFAPGTNFTPQAGSWGIHGILSIPDRENCFVFFVSYGQSQGEHNFDEGITSDGVLSWQSQPSQGLDNKTIKALIEHDDLMNNIYLFLRESTLGAYQYKGRLGYLSHDRTREKPVYFQWQLLDWDELHKVTPSTPIETAEMPPMIETSHQGGVLTKTNKRPARKRQGTDLRTFRTRKAPDYAARDARNRALGLNGEQLVLQFEEDRLIAEGKSELAKAIIHTSVLEGDGAGYDIRSYNSDGSPRFIEVKTTQGGIDTDFFISPNELAFSEKNPQSFFLYRVFAYDKESNSGQLYIHSGSLLDAYEAEPTGYKLTVR